MNKHTIHILTFMFLWCCGAGASATELYFVHSDHLNTPQVITDFNQQVVWEGKRLPFGETDVTSTQIEFNLRFPGQYYDLETGLHYNYFRDYDPGLGRYVQSDPIGLQGGLNTYGYSYQNPMMFSDPEGLNAVALGGAGAAGAALAGLLGLGGGGSIHGSGTPSWLCPHCQQQSSKPDWWPDGIPHPDDPPQETQTECPVDPPSGFDDDDPFPDRCSKVAATVMRACVASGGNPNSCATRAFLAYLACKTLMLGGS